MLIVSIIEQKNGLNNKLKECDWPIWNRNKGSTPRIEVNFYIMKKNFVWNDFLINTLNLDRLINWINFEQKCLSNAILNNIII